MNKITAVKGFNDILPDESSKWHFIEGTVREVFSLYGFDEIRIPIVEKTEVFSRSIGEATDIVEKEMYTFPDKNEISLTLRPEGTASIVRAFVQNSLSSKNPINKLYYTGPMFRYERPQKGRYRQFYQIGAEVFGGAEPYYDAEILSMLMHFFKKIGLTGLSLEINSLGCQRCRNEYKKALVEYFSDKVDKLCENCTRRLKSNPLRILDCKAHACNELKADAPAILHYLCEGCTGHFDEVKKHLDDLKVDFTVNDRMVRGLDYYTSTAFEVTTDRLGAQNAVAAGGRYDNLVEQFSGPKTPAIGFAIGIERLILLLDEKRDYKNKPQVFIATMGEEGKKYSFKLINELRKLNISCEMEYAKKSLKSQMRQAGKNGYKFVLFIGGNELYANTTTLRNMSTKEECVISLDNIVDEIVNRMS